MMTYTEPDDGDNGKPQANIDLSTLEIQAIGRISGTNRVTQVTIPLAILAALLETGRENDHASHTDGFLDQTGAEQAPEEAGGA